MSAGQDQYLKVMGFLVQIGSAGTGKGTAENWNAVSGGGQEIDVSESTVGNETYKTFVPGLTHITPLSLEGYLNASRKTTIQWITDTVAGQEPRQTVTVIPLKADGSQAKQMIYGNCLIAEYVYPNLDAHSHEALKEKITLRPETLTIQ